MRKRERSENPFTLIASSSPIVWLVGTTRRSWSRKAKKEKSQKAGKGDKKGGVFTRSLTRSSYTCRPGYPPSYQGLMNLGGRAEISP